MESTPTSHVRCASCGKVFNAEVEVEYVGGFQGLDLDDRGELKPRPPPETKRKVLRQCPHCREWNTLIVPVVRRQNTTIMIIK